MEDFAVIRSQDGGRTGHVVQLLDDCTALEMRENDGLAEGLLVVNLAGHPVDVGDWVEINQQGEVCAA